MQKREIILQYLFVVGMLILTVWVLYGPTLSYEFCNDDKVYILRNIMLDRFDQVQHIWQDFNTRFLPGLTFALSYHWHGAEPFGFRIWNLVLHALNAFCVYLLVRWTFRSPGLINSAWAARAHGLAFWSAMIFLVHPLQTESVIYITQRITLLGSFFYLSAILFHIQARLRSRPVLWACSYSMMMLGVFSKEMVITLPFMILIYDKCFFPGPQKTRFRCWGFLLPYFLLIIPLLGIFISDSGDSLLALRHQLKPFDGCYFLTTINVLRTYLRLFVFPVHQSIDYQYPLTQIFFEWPTLFSLSLLMLLLGVAVWQWPRQRLLSFAIFWFFLTTSVESGTVCFVQRAVLLEHWLYLPLVALALFVPYAIYRGMKEEGQARMLLIVLICIGGILTFQRKNVWRTELSLWEDVIKKSPQHFRPYAIVGVYYSRLGRYQAALESYQRVLPYFDQLTNVQQAQVLINIGAIYGKTGDYQKELEYNQRALEAYPDHVQALSNIGYAYTLMGELDRGQEYGKLAVAVDPDFAQAYNNLGVNRARAGELLDAVVYFEKALALEPDYALAAKNLKLAQENLESQHADIPRP